MRFQNLFSIDQRSKVLIPVHGFQPEESEPRIPTCVRRPQEAAAAAEDGRTSAPAPRSGSASRVLTISTPVVFAQCGEQRFLHIVEVTLEVALNLITTADKLSKQSVAPAPLVLQIFVITADV